MIKKEVPEQFIAQAEEHMQAGRYESAVSIYRRLVEIYPSEDSFLLNLAWAYHDSGKLSEAIECFEQLLERELEQAVFTGFAYDELVRIFKSQGLYDRLIAVCEKAVKVQPEDTGYLGDLADAYAKAGSIEKAVDIFSRMIEIDPLEADFYCRLGSALIHAGDFPGGEGAYKKAAEIENSAAGRFYYKLADAYSQTGQDERAEAAQRKSLTFCADKPLFHLNLCDILAKQQKFSEARDACRQAIRLNPADAAVYYNRLGNTLFRAGFHEEAIDTFSQAIALEPENRFHYLNVAECYKVLGLDDEAAKYLKRSEKCQRDIKHAPSFSAPL